MNSGRAATTFYCLLLLIEVAVFHRRVLFYPGYVLPWDFRSVHLPLAAAVADSLAAGQFPWWDPNSYCGTPLFANIQTAFFSPSVLAATVASLFLGHDALARLLTFAAMLQLFLGGVGAFLLARHLGVSPAAAWISGTMYALGCFFTSQMQHLGAVTGASWLPMVWLAVLHLRTPGRSAHSAAVLAVSLALTVFAGLPQIAVAAFGSALLLAIGLAVAGQARRMLPFQILLAWLWALAISAVQLGPTTELTRNSVAKFRAEWLGGGGGIKSEALPSLVMPDYWSVFDLSHFNGPGDATFLYLYGSLLGLVLALAAIMWKPSPTVKVLSVFWILCSIGMLGDSTAAGRALFESLPVSIRIGIHPEFWLCVFSLGMAVLAGVGADTLLPSTRLRILAGAVIALDLTLVGSGRPFNTMSLAVEPGMWRDSAEGSTELIGTLRRLANQATPPYRFDIADASFAYVNSAPLFALPTSGGCDPLAPERIIQVRRAFAPGPRWGTCYGIVNLSSPVVNLLNARYILSRKELPADLRLVMEEAGMKLYENPRAMRRFFLMDQVLGAENLAESSRRLHDAAFDPAKSVILEPPLPEAYLPGGASEGTVAVLRYLPAEVAVRTDSPKPSVLVAADAFYPGWEASIDGNPTRIHAANAGFRGIAVPAGQHVVEMRYVPRIFYLFAPISAAAVAGVLWALVR